VVLHAEAVKNIKKSEHLYSALHGIQTTLKRLGMDHTAFNLPITPCEPLPRKRSPDGPSTKCGGGHLIAAHYSFIDLKRMKGWVGLVGWPIADGLLTSVVTRQLQVERRTAKEPWPETDVLPLSHVDQPRYTHSSNTFHRYCVLYKIKGEIIQSNQIDISVMLSNSSSFSCVVTIRIVTLTTEQWIDVQSHSRSSTFVTIERPYMTSW